MDLRIATEADAAAIAAIYRPYVESSTISFEEGAPDAAEMRRRIARDLNGGHPWLVGEENGRLIGYAASSAFRARPAYRWTVETGIYLAGEFYGRGHGSRLLASLLTLLQRQGYVAAIGAIALPNDASVALHEKLGFAHAGTYCGVGFKLGKWLDVGLWQRELAPRVRHQAEPVSIASVYAPE